MLGLDHGGQLVDLPQSEKWSGERVGHARYTDHARHPGRLPHLGAGGRVITIGSAGADRIVGATGTVYYMTKSALQAFTRGLAQELGARDITANLVQPGSTDTEMNPADGEFADFQRSLIPLGRYGTPADIAATVAFLASPGARQITGTIVNVDGGMMT